MSQSQSFKYSVSEFERLSNRALNLTSVSIGDQESLHNSLNNILNLYNLNDVLTFEVIRFKRDSYSDHQIAFNLIDKNNISSVDFARALKKFEDALQYGKRKIDSFTLEELLRLIDTHISDSYKKSDEIWLFLWTYKSEDRIKIEKNFPNNWKYFTMKISEDDAKILSKHLSQIKKFISSGHLPNSTSHLVIFTEKRKGCLSFSFLL